MKKIIKFKTLLFLFAFIQTNSFAIEFIGNPSYSSYCPNEWIEYVIKDAQLYLNDYCGFQVWVKNGIIKESQGNFYSGTSKSLNIKWDDISQGEIILKSYGCENSYNIEENTYSITINSLSDLVTDQPIGPSEVNLGIVNAVSYRAKKITYPGTTNYVESYNWTVPSGWSIINGQGTDEILVQPDECSGGEVYYYGINELCTNAEMSSADYPLFLVKRTTTSADWSKINITGSNSICNENQTYTINSLPDDFFVSNWSIGNNNLIGFQSKNKIQATISRIGNSKGSTTLSATITNGCESTYIRSINIQAGPTTVLSGNISNSISGCSIKILNGTIVNDITFNYQDDFIFEGTFSIPKGVELQINN